MNSSMIWEMFVFVSCMGGFGLIGFILIVGASAPSSHDDDFMGR